jgi:hypothetical protein
MKILFLTTLLLGHFSFANSDTVRPRTESESTSSLADGYSNCCGAGLPAGYVNGATSATNAWNGTYSDGPSSGPTQVSPGGGADGSGN